MNANDFNSNLNAQTAFIGASTGMSLVVSRAADLQDATDAMDVDMLEEASVNALFERVGTPDQRVVTARADESKLRSSFATMTPRLRGAASTGRHDPTSRA